MELSERIIEDRARIAQQELDTLQRVLTYAKRQAKLYRAMSRTAEETNMNIAACLHDAQAQAYSDIVAEIRSARKFLGNIPE